jgi:hypothetical protein
VRYSFFPLNEATKIALFMAFFGCCAIFASFFIGYFAINVTVLVIFMRLIGFIKLKLSKIKKIGYKPKLLYGFSALAGFNKGNGGGEYGPVLTMGQIFQVNMKKVLLL